MNDEPQPSSACRPGAPTPPPSSATSALPLPSSPIAPPSPALGSPPATSALAPADASSPPSAVLPPPGPPHPPDEQPTESFRSPWDLTIRRFARHKLGMGSFFLLCILYVLAAGCEFFAPTTREWRDLRHSYCPPQPLHFSRDGFHVGALRRLDNPVTFARTYLEDPAVRIPLGFFVRGEPYRLFGLIPLDRHFFGVDREKLAALGRDRDPDAVFYLLGADKYGRDVLSRLIYGARISLSVGLISIVVTFVLGVTLGGISGYVGGGWDNVIQRTIEVINSLPQLPLWLAIGAIFPADWSSLTVYFCVTIALSLLAWTGLARVVRGKILALREEDYAVAARLLGASHARVLFRHLVPGFASHIIVTLTLSVPGMILGETVLSFLGLGLRPPIVSWGVMLQDCQNLQTVGHYPWLLAPVLFIVLTILAFNFAGDALRDAADPYSSR
ncbi:ABC transporter permease [Horticoccus luteus]|uniref:ABC transporter permease n=1 Tax=Horticoccus luteus TaxID=2862869 RepID=A0A8F9XHB0_9BACT|nr:ABC transporter permease [Horticoccus luteus]QYM79135.1 ABC transporter permease [Horticoccus luteus]